MKVKTHKFCGKRFNIHIGTYYGLTCESNDPNRDIYINTQGLSDRQILHVIIHESLHAANPELSEEVVDKMGRDIKSFLWRLGYRTKGK